MSDAAGRLCLCAVPCPDRGWVASAQAKAEAMQAIAAMDDMDDIPDFDDIPDL